MVMENILKMKKIKRSDKKEIIPPFKNSNNSLAYPSKF